LKRFRKAFGISGIWVITTSNGDTSVYQWNQTGGSETFTGKRLSDDRAVVTARISGGTVEWTVGDITYSGTLGDDSKTIDNGRFWRTETAWKQDNGEWLKELTTIEMGTFTAASRSIEPQAFSRFFGRLLGMSILHEAPLGMLLVPSLCKQLLGMEASFDDLRYVPGLADADGCGWYTSFRRLLVNRVPADFVKEAPELERCTTEDVSASLCCLVAEMPSRAQQTVEVMAKTTGKTPQDVRDELLKSIAEDEPEALPVPHGNPIALTTLQAKRRHLVTGPPSRPRSF